MLRFITSLLSSGTSSAGAGRQRVPDGERVYAVGDIHGRCDLFRALVDAIEEDDAASPEARSLVILLGDLVDRGPDSAGVLKLARGWRERRDVRVLMGNHEEMFLQSFEDKEVLRHFLRHGGKETILSYGVDRKAFTAATMKEAQQMMHDAVDPEDIAFIAAFEDRVQVGDYLFVHAGIDPARALDDQRQKDLRWIREPFLSHDESYEGGVLIVHGHTIRDEPETRGNRIGIDTGAYSSGRLTALVLEGAERRFIVAAEREDGTIAIER